MPVEVRVKDTNHDNFWDNDSGYSYQHQTSTAHSGPSGPSTNNHQAMKQSSENHHNNQQSQQHQQHQQNSHKKYKDSFEEEIQKQFDTQLQQASTHHEEAATAPHASYSLFTHHTEHQPSRQHHQQQQDHHHQHEYHHHNEGQESQHMPHHIFYHPPSNAGTTAHDTSNDLFKGMDFDALLEASHRDIAQSFPGNTQFQPEPQPQFAGGRQFTFHVPQRNQVQQHHHSQQQLLGGEEMMSQASQPHAVMVAPPSAFVAPMPLMHPPHPIQLLKITQPMMPHK